MLRNLMSRVEKIGLRGKTLHQAGHLLILLECSNAFKSVKDVEVFQEGRTPGPRCYVFHDKMLRKPGRHVLGTQIRRMTTHSLYDSGPPTKRCPASESLYRVPRYSFGDRPAEAYVHKCGYHSLYSVDHVQFAPLELIPDAVAVIHCLQKRLGSMGTTLNVANAVTLPSPGPVSTEAGIASQANVSVSLATTNGVEVAFGEPVVSDAFVERHALGVVHEEAAERLPRLAAHTSDKEAAQLESTKI